MNSWLGNLLANFSMRLTTTTKHCSFIHFVATTQASPMHITKSHDAPLGMDLILPTLEVKNNILNVGGCINPLSYE